MSPLFGRARTSPERDTPAVPAGADPDAASQPTTRRRGRLRRRARHLRRKRELLLRDLGGFTYELHRAPQAPAGGEDLLAGKLQQLTELDAELAVIERALGDPGDERVLREPGIGGFCPSCGEMHGSRDRFCSHCGHPVAEQSSAAPTGPAGEEQPAPEGLAAHPEGRLDPAAGR